MYSKYDKGIKVWCIQGRIKVSMYQGMMKSRYDQGNQSYELEGGASGHTV